MGSDHAQAVQTSKASYLLVAWAANNEVSVEDSHKEVSTLLTLHDESWTSPRKRKSMESCACDAEGRSWLSEDPVATFMVTRDEQEKTPGHFEDPWKIKKRLTFSDLGNQRRLLLQTNLVKDHILPFLGTNLIREVESKGVQFAVWDQDTESEHHLLFKRWTSTKSYVFIGMWHKDFVTRRGLKQGDLIGLYWDSSRSRLNFSVLERAQVCQSGR